MLYFLRDPETELNESIELAFRDMKHRPTVAMLLRVGEDDHNLVLVKARRNNRWGPPKGGADHPFEPWMRVGWREVEEETGLSRPRVLFDQYPYVCSFLVPTSPKEGFTEGKDIHFVTGWTPDDPTGFHNGEVADTCVVASYSDIPWDSMKPERATILFQTIQMSGLWCVRSRATH